MQGEVEEGRLEVVGEAEDRHQRTYLRMREVVVEEERYSGEEVEGAHQGAEQLQSCRWLW